MSDETHGQPWGGILIPAATFLVGLLIGGLLIGVGRTDGEASGAEPGTDASAAPSPATGSAAAPGDTVVTVSAACKMAAEKVRQATSLLRSTAGDVRKFRPDAIVKALNRLEDLDSQTRPLLRQCSQVEVSTGASPVPSATPTGS